MLNICFLKIIYFKCVYEVSVSGMLVTYRVENHVIQGVRLTHPSTDNEVLMWLVMFSEVSELLAVPSKRYLPSKLLTRCHFNNSLRLKEFKLSHIYEKRKDRS